MLKNPSEKHISKCLLEKYRLENKSREESN